MYFFVYRINLKYKANKKLTYSLHILTVIELIFKIRYTKKIRKVKKANGNVCANWMIATVY